MPAIRPEVRLVMREGIEVACICGIDDVKEVLSVREVTLRLLLREELG